MGKKWIKEIHKCAIVVTEESATRQKKDGIQKNRTQSWNVLKNKGLIGSL